MESNPGLRRFGPSASPRRQPHSRHHARNSSRHIHVGFDLRRQAVGLERLRDQARWMHGARGSTGTPEDDWPSFDLIKPITKIVLTNRDHVRDAELFRTRCAARLVAGTDEVTQLAPIAIDEAVREEDLIAGALRVIHLPGKSAGEIGLYFDPAHHAVSREMGGILLLGDAIIGNPPGALSLIPELKLDDPSKLKRSLRKLLDYDFDVLLLCDGQSVLRGGKLKVAEFLNTLA